MNLNLSFRLAILTAATTMLAGCFSFKPATDPTRFYVLHSLPPGAAVSVGAAPIARPLFLSPVETPVYLDDVRLAVRHDRSRLEFAEFHRWAEPVRDGASRVLREDLAVLLGGENVANLARRRPVGDYLEVQISLASFELRDDSQAWLAARWRILDGRKGVVFHSQTSEFKRDTGAAPDDIGAGVQALSETLADLSREIARAAAKITVGAAAPRATP